jgi:GNAT superfamily N-acetyltransferase
VLDGVTIRAATPRDWVRFAEIIHGAPDAASIAVSGSAARARRFGAELVRLHSRHRSRTTMAAVLDERVVAVFAYSADNDRPTRVYRIVHLWAAMRVFGPFGIAGWLRRARVRRRVQPELPRECFYLAEVDVDPAYRNLGIGSDVLRWVEREAIRQGFRQMTLRVTLTNPAVRFYERHGFTIVDTITDHRYEALTGSHGRALMHKRCTPLDASTDQPPASGSGDEPAGLERLPSRPVQAFFAAPHQRAL